VLLGFEDACAAIFESPEKPAEESEFCEGIGAEWLFNWRAPEGPREHTVAGARYLDKKTATNYYFPMGTPWVDGKTSTINWKFGCPFQTQIYHLMQEPKRRGICAECHKYFVKDKPNRKYCSTGCSGERKRKKALDDYYLHGKARRRESRARRTSVRGNPESPLMRHAN
jgi:hypothetical protein